MNPNLTELRAQIKQCEEFINLCERIKHLEKLHDGRLQSKKSNIKSSRAEILNQLSEAEKAVEYLEASANVQRPMGADEVELVKGQIRTARIRVSSLKQSADGATYQIEQIDSQLNASAQELEQLYPKLEQLMLLGLDPNNVAEKLEALRQQKIALSQAIKADVASCNAAEQKPATKKTQAKSDGVSFSETEFYEGLARDLAEAKNSVEIVSPFIDESRCGAIMAALATLVSQGVSVTVYTRPVDEQKASMRLYSQTIIRDAHRMRMTIVQRSDLEYNAAIIDKRICWEGTINILGGGSAHDSMRRTVSSMHVRELRHFLFNAAR